MRSAGHRPLFLLIIALMAICPGCVSRRLTVVSDPPGALVEVDGQRLGVTPVSMDFTYYGTRNITLSKPGYQTQTIMQPQAKPWYQRFPFEFFSDNMALTHLTDRHVFNYRLIPAGPQAEDPGALTERGRNFRSQSLIPMAGSH